MTKEELIEFIKENLRVDAQTSMPMYGEGGGTTIRLYLGKECISETWID